MKNDLYHPFWHNYYHYPQVEAELCWPTMYVRGPISGIANVNNKLAFFVMVDENIDSFNKNWYRRFLLFDLNSKENMYEREKHKKTEKIRKGAKRDKWFLKKKLSDWLDKKGFPDYSKNEIVGWFEI